MDSELALLESKSNLKLGSVDKSRSVWPGCQPGFCKENRLLWDCSAGVSHCVYGAIICTEAL